MQAGPVVVPAQPSYPSLLPGPFILLLALPVIPLLLFSVGARPPDTSRLPFSTDDLWQTTAFITAVGAVVLCVGLYPGLLGDVGNWIADGSVTGGRGSSSSGMSGNWWDFLLGRDPPPVHTNQQHRQERHARHQRYTHNPNYQGHGPIRPPPGIPRQQFRGSTHHAHGLPPQQLPIALPPRFTHSDEYRIALRSGPFSQWYSPTPPSPALCFFIFVVIAAVLIVCLGKILGNAYDADSKSSSPSSSRRSRSSGSGSGSGSGSRSGDSKGGGEDWPARELRKRKSEKPEETKKRVDKEAKAWREGLKKMGDEEKKKAMSKRKKEVENAKHDLKKRKMPTDGLELYLEGGEGAPSGKSEKGLKDSRQAENPSKLKQLIDSSVGKVKVNGKDVGGKQSSSTMPTVANVPTKGPGWETADDAVAQAAIRGGAARAESLGNQLVAQKGS